MHIRINRIRLEFKADSSGNRLLGTSVLIESDWNLKKKSTPLMYDGNTVLIESDWNLKSRSRTNSFRRVNCINRIRLEFKVVRIPIEQNALRY